MTSEYLRYFIEVCNSGSIQGASKKLLVSPQGIGQGLQRLEKTVGLKLLERTQTGVMPTEFGRIYYEQACIADRELQKLDELAGEYRHKEVQTVTVGTLGKNKLLNELQKCVDGYKREHPESPLELNVVTMQNSTALLDGVRSGEVDVGWMFNFRKFDGFRYYTISDASRVVLLISKDNPLAAKKTVNWNQLRELRYVTAGEDDPFSDLMRFLCEKHGFAQRIAAFSTDNAEIAGMIDSGAAAMLLRECYLGLIQNLCKNAVSIPLDNDLFVSNTLFIRSDRAETGELGQLLDYMVSYSRNIMGMYPAFAKQ